MFFKFCYLFVACGLTSIASASTEGPLAAAAYSVLPTPQKVTLSGAEFRLSAGWVIRLDDGVAETDVAVACLREDLLKRHGIRLLAPNSSGHAVVRLTVKAGSVKPEATQDRDADAIAAQAYHLDLTDGEIRITANANAGLFYGVQTLVQLARRRGGNIVYPAGQITDWPDLQLRQLYWDDAHHLEHLEVLKQAMRQAAFFKINAFILKLDGHFQYRGAKPVVEPQALSPAELQELTDYGLKYHVQLIPYLDAPGHVSFILKHPEYAGLRAFADCNYEFCTTNPETYKLLFGMYQELIDANKGARYFYLSTDEPYYVGMANSSQCGEILAKPDIKDAAGRALTDFIEKAGSYLHDHGRQVIFWGEPPLRPSDVAKLPPYLLNGETPSPDFDKAFKSRGIREMVYTSTEGEEKLFPDYHILPPQRRLHTGGGGKPRVQSAIDEIISPITRGNADLMGMSVAGWADMGLHPETFWMGYATIAAAGWNPRTEASQAMADFFPLFHGPSAQHMDRVYQLMSCQAQFWADSWEAGPSKSRKPIWGNSNTIFRPPHPAQDQFIALPVAPRPRDLARESSWSVDNARRIQLTAQARSENDELLSLLRDNAKHVEFNAYNIEIFRSIALLARHNLQMLRDLDRMDGLLNSARDSAKTGDATDAVARLDDAINLAHDIRKDRDTVLARTTDTWYQSWLPRTSEANGRTFLHVLDDVKDHLPDRTIGMEYLLYREFQLPLGQWVDSVQRARNIFALAHNLTERTDHFAWSVAD